MSSSLVTRLKTIPSYSGKVAERPDGVAKHILSAFPIKQINIPLTRTTLPAYTAPNSTAFLWATGIEDTFITEPWPATGRILDEYELTGHYDRWEQDIALMASLGVKTCRYGIPWHKIQPARDQWDWRWADGPLEQLIELGIDPIVDLVHYGTPAWIDGAFTNPEYPALVAEFARRVAERYQGRIHCYTPAQRASHHRLVLRPAGLVAPASARHARLPPRDAAASAGASSKPRKRFEQSIPKS